MNLSFFNTLDSIVELYDDPPFISDSVELYLRIFKSTHQASSDDADLFKELLDDFFSGKPPSEEDIVSSSLNIQP